MYENMSFLEYLVDWIFPHVTQMQRNDYFTKLHYTFKADLREYEDEGAIIIPNPLYDMAKGWEARKWYEEERSRSMCSASPNDSAS
jgi:hypothetical protein